MKAKQYDPLEVLKRNRANALDLSTAIGKSKLVRLLKEAEADLNARLRDAKGVSGPGKDSFTAVQLEATMRQIKQVTRELTHGVKGLLVDQAGIAADKATGGLLQYMNEAQRKFSGIGGMPLAFREASILDRATMGARSSILNRIASSGEENAVEEDAEESPAKMGILQRYGVSTIQVFEEKLQTGLIAQKPWGQVRDEITASSTFLQGAPAHWAERIVRTETMGAYNRANWTAINESHEILGDMVKIIAEHLDDGRAGWDSFQVHGQIRRPNEAFQWKDGLYQHPPNRPNDRACIVPHREAWPIPDYLRWRSDSEVLREYHRFRKTGSPGPRPRMTTVPLEKFGK